ncbi:unnamed protein product [Ectocarpus sp. 8 AP-2014]
MLLALVLLAPTATGQNRQHRDRRRDVQESSPTQKLLSVQQRIDVVVVLEGPSDQTTALVFRDIAETVQDGLQNLGHPSTIVYCTNLVADHCFAKGGKFIILAPHNLASYFTGGGGLAVLEKQLLPPDAVLYNFEQIPCRWSRESTNLVEPGTRDRSLVSARTLQIYGSYTLWDYSEENTKRLLDMSIHADLVPLGFSSKLRSSSLLVAGGHVLEEQEHDDIDVLFIGMDTPTRQRTIRRLRDAGIMVFHPNSEGVDLFGAAFDAVSARSKIVINLNAFEGATTTAIESGSNGSSPGDLCDNGEWKMPRLARLLANGRFIVSEMSGSDSERAEFSGGVVFAPPERLAETCQFYLQRPELRMSIAQSGRRLFEQHLEADILRRPVGRHLAAHRVLDR